MPKSIRITLAAFCGLTVAAGLLALAIYLTLTGAPAFYQAAVERDPAVLEEDSDQCLQQAAALASKLQSPGEWQAIFSADQINGWLAVDLARNYGQSLPPEITNPRIDFHSGAATLACTYRNAGHETVMSIAFDLYLSEPNVMALRLRRVRAGLLAGAAGRRAARHRAGWKWFRSLGAVASDLRRSGGAGSPLAQRRRRRRQLQLEAIELREGEIYIAGRTMPRCRPNWLAASGPPRLIVSTTGTPKSRLMKISTPSRPMKKIPPPGRARPTTIPPRRHCRRRSGSRRQTSQPAAQRGSSRVGGEEEPPALIALRLARQNRLAPQSVAGQLHDDFFRLGLLPTERAGVELFDGTPSARHGPLEREIFRAVIGQALGPRSTFRRPAVLPAPGAQTLRRFEHEIPMRRPLGPRRHLVPQHDESPRINQGDAAHFHFPALIVAGIRDERIL